MTDTRHTITINMDAKCAECGKGGAVASGICLSCTTKAMGKKPMKSAIGRAVQKRWHTTLKPAAGKLGADLRSGKR